MHEQIVRRDTDLSGVGEFGNVGLGVTAGADVGWLGLGVTTGGGVGWLGFGVLAAI